MLSHRHAGAGRQLDGSFDAQSLGHVNPVVHVGEHPYCPVRDHRALRVRMEPVGLADDINKIRSGTTEITHRRIQDQRVLQTLRTVSPSRIGLRYLPLPWREASAEQRHQPPI